MIEKTSTTKKAVLFVRGDENSRKTQLESLNSYCNTHNLDIVKTFECDGKNLNYRTTFNEMVKYVKGKKSKMAIVAYNLSQLRMRSDEYIYLDRLRTQKDSEIHFVKENFVIHKYSSQNDISLWNMYIFATKFYRDSLGDKIKMVLDFKYNVGKYPHLAPIGYLNSRDCNNKPDIIVDSLKAPIIADLFKEYATGKHSISTLTKEARKRGLKTKNGDISKDCIHHMLYNPFYCGEFYIAGKLYPHKYPRIIDKSLFDMVQDVLDRRSR